MRSGYAAAMFAKKQTATRTAKLPVWAHLLEALEAIRFCLARNMNRATSQLLDAPGALKPMVRHQNA